MQLASQREKEGFYGGAMIGGILLAMKAHFFQNNISCFIWANCKNKSISTVPFFSGLHKFVDSILNSRINDNFLILSFLSSSFNCSPPLQFTQWIQDGKFKGFSICFLSEKDGNGSSNGKLLLRSLGVLLFCYIFWLAWEMSWRYSRKPEVKRLH